MKFIDKLKTEVIEGLRENPLKLAWQLLWFLPIYVLCVTLSVCIGVSSLSWNQGVQFYWRLVS